MTEGNLIREIREYRDAHAARFNYNVRAMVDDLRKRQAASGRKAVSLAPRRKEVKGK